MPLKWMDVLTDRDYRPFTLYYLQVLYTSLYHNDRKLPNDLFERERGQEKSAKSVQQKHLKSLKLRKKSNMWDRRALVSSFRSWLSRTLWSIDGLIAVGAGWRGGPRAGGGLRSKMWWRGADRQGKAGDLRSPGSPHPGSPGNMQASLQIRIWKREITSLLPPGRCAGARRRAGEGVWLVFVLTWGAWCRPFLSFQ